jgi:tetratricopeptide (TPR) repeat protein
MFRVTSLTEMPEAQLNRWIKRLGLLVFLGLVAFVAFYAVDRFRAPQPSMMDRELSAMEAAVVADPADIASRGRLADLYLAAERYDDAIAQYSEILRTGKQDEAAYVSRGRAYELKGDLPAAAADYEQVVAIAKDGEMANVDAMLAFAYYGLGNIALQGGEADAAIDHLTKALGIKRTDADTMNLLGAAYVAAGQPEKAIEPLRRAILFVPTGWSQPYAALAEAYTAIGEADLAEWAAAMAIGQDGDPAGAATRLEAIADGSAALDARIGLGIVAEIQDDPARAAEWYRAALDLDADNQAAMLGLSRVTAGGEGHPTTQPTPSAEGSN